MSKMNVDKIRDEDMQDLFSSAFEDIGSVNNITEFECKCKRTVGNSGTAIAMEVMIIGLAGSPTYEAIHEGELEDLDTISISRDEESKLDFERDTDNDYILNTNDYIIAYKSV